jgi:hypothetical protein
VIKNNIVSGRREPTLDSPRREFSTYRVVPLKRSPVKAAIQSILNRVGYQLVQKHRIDNFMEEIAATTIAANNGIDVLKLIVQEYIQSHPNPFFIQIGANDGMYDDDLRKYILDYSWQGVLVEPQPGPFARLVQNYRGHSGLRFENAAIGRTSGVASLYGFSGTHPRRLPPRCLHQL